MRVAIMQPTYLPWIGYFDLIDQVDTFVFLDIVQFEKRSWQQRNRIRSAQGLEWLSVPVFNKGRYGQRICDVQFDCEKFPDKHLRQLEHNYRRAPYFHDYFPGIAQILATTDSLGSLSRLCVTLIEHLCNSFAIGTKLLSASSLNVTGKRSSLLLSIIEEVGGTHYLSPVGSLDYLREDHPLFLQQGVELQFHRYDHPTYSQVHSPFLPYASAVDLLFNEGPASAAIIRSGRGVPYAAEELIQ